MSTKFDRKIKKKFFVPLIAKNWNNNNYYSDDNNQKKKKKFHFKDQQKQKSLPFFLVFSKIYKRTQ